MVNLYEYMDYRRFLADRFTELKQINPRLSYRVFNRRAGIRSSGFLKLVLDGKRNLAEEGIRMMIRGFGLSEPEGRYFSTLVRFNQAQVHHEKDRCLQEILHLRQLRHAKPLAAAQYHLFSRWYYVAILEHVRLDSPGVKNVQWLHRHIHPTVGLREIQAAVKELVQLGLLRYEADGRLSRAESMVTTPDEVQSVAITNFHVQMAGLAARAVRHEPRMEREFSSLTIATSAKGYQMAKREIQAFRKRLHSILEHVEAEPKEIVGQVNLQLFSLNRKT